VTVTSAVMIRTFIPPITEVKEPSGRWLRTGRPAVRGQPDQELRLRGGGQGQELRGVKAAVQRHQHRLIQQVQKPARGVPDTAPISARVPVSHKVISWMTG
jgi:hypothetical protein